MLAVVVLMNCRLDCGACCIAPSISSPIPASVHAPAMPNGKPAGVRCSQLSADNLCYLFGDPRRPKTCGGFQAEVEICGDSREQALINLTQLEGDTRV